MPLALILALTSDSFALYSYDLETKEVQLEMVSPLNGYDHMGSPEWSPDGTRIAFDGAPDGEWGEGKVFVVETATGESTDLGYGNVPTWSPDGTFLYYQSLRKDRPAKTLKRAADGSDAPVPVGDGYYPTCSPDGAFLLTHAATDNPRELEILNLATGEKSALQLPSDHSLAGRPELGGPRSIVVPTTSDDGVALRRLPLLGRPEDFRIGEPITLYATPPDLTVRKAANAYDLDITVRKPVAAYDTGDVFTVLTGEGPIRVVRFAAEADPAAQPEVILQGWSGMWINAIGVTRDGKKLAFTSNLFYSDDTDRSETDLVP